MHIKTFLLWVSIVLISRFLFTQEKEKEDRMKKKKKKKRQKQERDALKQLADTTTAAVAAAADQAFHPHRYSHQQDKKDDGELP